MKKNLLLLLVASILVFGLVNTAFAELKLAFVNSDQILAGFKEAQEAQAKLDVEAKKIQDEYQAKLVQLDSLNQAYERQKMIMSEARRKEKETEMLQLQQSIQVFQKEKMGPQGEIYRKQNEIVGPVLEKVKKVISEVASENNYDFVFDTVAGNILYAEPVHDITEKVLYQLERSNKE